MILAMTMLISLTTAIFLRPIGYLFELLAASSTNFIRTKNNSVGFVDKNNSRTFHVAGVNASNPSFISNNNEIVKNSRSNIIGFDTRSIPYDAENAQELANVFGALITARANGLLHLHHLNVAAALFKLRREETIFDGYDDDDDDDDDDELVREEVFVVVIIEVEDEHAFNANTLLAIPALNRQLLICIAS